MAVLIKLAALLCVACAVPGRAQKLYTANGTMYLEMDGGELLLCVGAGCQNEIVGPDKCFIGSASSILFSDL